MTLEEAIRKTINQFPFHDYMIPENASKGPYSNVGETVLRHLRPGSQILDFGCGPCDKTAILQFMGFRCSAYDDLQDDWHKIPGTREKIRSFAATCGIDFKLANGGPLPFERESFDMVMLHDVLEHLHDSPRDLLNDLLALLRPNGLLFVTVPNAVNVRKRVDVLFGKTNLPRFEGYYWYPGLWRGHIREYVRADLLKLCEYLDLQIVELRGCDHMLQKLPSAIRPVYLFVTNILQGWKDSWALVASKRRDWSPRKTLPEAELVKILGRSTPYHYLK